MSTPKLIKLKRMTTAECKILPSFNITYGTVNTKFGNCMAAFKNKALCFLTFYDGNPPLDKLQKVWPGANLIEDTVNIPSTILNLFNENSTDEMEIYVNGTVFEVDVWEALLKIQKGVTVSYEDIAKALGKPKAVRAAARAIAKNNVAYFIPCHRVIKKNGLVHRYGCGAHRKVAMLRSEGAIE